MRETGSEGGTPLYLGTSVRKVTNYRKKKEGGVRARTNEKVMKKELEKKRRKKLEGKGRGRRLGLRKPPGWEKSR